MIEMFQEWYDNRREYAKKSKERTEGKVVGSSWEMPVGGSMEFRIRLGGSTPSGYISTYQKKGIARVLFMEMVGNLKKVGVDTINTFVNWRGWGLLPFFDAMGFHEGI